MTELPVFGSTFRKYSNRELTLRVYTLLKRLRAFKGRRKRPDFEDVLNSARDDFSVETTGLPTPLLRLEKIKVHADLPAFFVFLNWDDFGWSRPRHQLRDMANVALIRELRDSNTMSRILVSTVHDVRDANAYGLGFAESLTRNVKNPLIGQISRYSGTDNVRPQFADAHSVRQRGAQHRAAARRIAAATRQLDGPFGF
ncbi:MAG: hypothetical protein R3D80_13170 [Paracoccaceae bacterium]